MFLAGVYRLLVLPAPIKRDGEGQEIRRYLAYITTDKVRAHTHTHTHTHTQPHTHTHSHTHTHTHTLMYKYTHTINNDTST